MKAFVASIFVAVLFISTAARAQQQDVVWVQVEAHPSLTTAQDRARSYAASLPDVSGFALGGGWYGIVLGPYLRSDAEQVLQVYRAEGQIPRDSYVALSASLRQQFWPIGANVLNRGVIAAPNLPTPAQPATPAPQVQIEPADETPAQARRSEGRLTAQERRELQTALKWAGFYSAAIDGAFGRGTRSSMAAWQSANGFEPTGTLTTLQRTALMDQYNAPLTSVGMQLIRETEAGIEIQLPMGVVKFDGYNSPFAQFDSATDLGAQVLLISQPGTQATLFALNDIMQTLEIVPLDGPRDRKSDSFVLTGENSRIVSHTEAALADGQIKGFTLIWPAGDEARRSRVLDAMRASFRRIDGVLAAVAGAEDVQQIDLVSGLQVRKPRLSRSGFYVDQTGSVVTTTAVVDNCTRITLDDEYEAELVLSDPSLGVAVLRPKQSLSPIDVARFSQGVPRLQSEVVVSGYSFEGVLGAPTLTFGTLADIKGLRGETELNRLALAALPGDAGGPVFDTTGSVMGMLLAQPNQSRQLPGDVSFSADSRSIQTVMAEAGLQAQADVPLDQISPEDLSRMASGMTVLVSCWD
jgi:S1-C subfamily serine protease/peptidoglycan hydrolase-like protein with peptidoglycan-binding domain